MESGTGSRSKTELVAALHRLRSVLARLKAGLELAEMDGEAPPVEEMIHDVGEALEVLQAAEMAVLDVAPVLVLDDDARLAELTARGLRRFGYPAESGREWRQPRSREVVVLDLSLAESWSAEQRAALRVIRPIVITGSADSAARAFAESFDASVVLLKPVELEVLAAAVSRRAGEDRG